MDRNIGLETLLDLNGEVLVQDGGYWVRIEAWRVDACPQIPHGIRYALTLHDRYGTRVLGYDNAHAVKPLRARFSGRKVEYDHRHAHRRDRGVPYSFSSAEQLLSDFFADVDSYLKVNL